MRLFQHIMPIMFKPISHGMGFQEIRVSEVSSQPASSYTLLSPSFAGAISGRPFAVELFAFP